MMLEAIESGGIAIEGLVDGLPVTLPELNDTSARIDWDVYAELLDRIEERARDVMTPEEIGERCLRMPGFDFLRQAARLAVSPRQLYEVAGRFVAPALFANVVVTQEWQPSGRLVVSGELPPGYRPCVTVFRLCHGNVAALPRVLDLPPSVIEEQTVSGTTGHLVLRPPASHAISTRLRRAVKAVGTFGETWRAFAKQQLELEASLDALRTSRRELHQLLERLPDGVLIHESGVIRWANAALLEIFGVPRVDDLVGRNMPRLFAARRPRGDRPRDAPCPFDAHRQHTA